MLELYLIWIKYLYGTKNIDDVCQMVKKTTWAYSLFAVGVCDLYDRTISCTLHRTGTLLHGRYYADLWYLKHDI